ncbi:MAG: aminotransferase class IV, partial [Candidatus Marinimicrobia bacterium]|nr:aminotransferase class IV [Candidatus Neomarinimicrobiota bacterium]
DIPVYEKNFNVEDVHTADEVFVTGTFAGVIPVISVDGKIIGNGTRGSITESLQNWYALDIEKLIEAS